MARPLRIEFEGGLYHVTSRGNGREDIYLSDEDRLLWRELMGEVCKRFNWVWPCNVLWRIIGGGIKLKGG